MLIEASTYADFIPRRQQGLSVATNPNAHLTSSAALTAGSGRPIAELTSKK